MVSLPVHSPYPTSCRRPCNVLPSLVSISSPSCRLPCGRLATGAPLHKDCVPRRLNVCSPCCTTGRGENAMTNAEQAPGQLPELAVLRQCLTELALPPAVCQTLDGTLTESEKRLQQRMEQMTWQIQRSALLGDIAGKIVHEIRNPLNAIFLHADVVLGELQCPT